MGYDPMIYAINPRNPTSWVPFATMPFKPHRIPFFATFSSGNIYLFTMYWGGPTKYSSMLLHRNGTLGQEVMNNASNAYNGPLSAVIKTKNIVC